MFLLLAGKAASDANPNKAALVLGVGDAIEPDHLIPASANDWGLAPLRRFHCIHIEAAGMSATAVISN
ncbi:hypothetical protein ACK4A1_01520 [Aeromonas veronii]